MFKNYYTKSETYNKEEVNNLLNRYVTNDTFNNFKEEINKLLLIVLILIRFKKLLMMDAELI